MYYIGKVTFLHTVLHVDSLTERHWCIWSSDVQPNHRPNWQWMMIIIQIFLCSLFWSMLLNINLQRKQLGIKNGLTTAQYIDMCCSSMCFSIQYFYFNNPIKNSLVPHQDACDYQIFNQLWTNVLYSSVLTAVIFGAMAVGQNSSFAPDYAEAKVSASRMFSLFDSVPSIDAYSDEGHKPVRYYTIAQNNRQLIVVLVLYMLS